MAARILNLDRPQAAPEPRGRGVASPAGAPSGPLERQPAGRPQGQHDRKREHSWRGASGRLYVHRVYSLIECPPLPPAGYMLVRCDQQGRRTPLRVGVGTSDAPTLNLAEVRQRGAQAGANEVHVSLDAATAAERRLAACDLRVGLFGTLAASAM